MSPSAVNLGGQASEEVVLKACPGCGKDSTRVIGGPGTAGGPKYWAGCDYCNWRTWGDTQAEAIAAWNTRTPHPSGDTGEIVERLTESAKAMRDWHADEWAGDCEDARTLIEQQAATIAELREVLEMTTRAVEIVNETMAEQGFGQSNNSVAVAQIARATLERTKQP